MTFATALRAAIRAADPDVVALQEFRAAGSHCTENECRRAELGRPWNL